MHFLFLKYLNSAQLALQDFIQYTAAHVKHELSYTFSLNQV